MARTPSFVLFPGSLATEGMVGGIGHTSLALRTKGKKRKIWSDRSPRSESTSGKEPSLLAVCPAPALLLFGEETEGHPEEQSGRVSVDPQGQVGRGVAPGELWSDTNHTSLTTSQASENHKHHFSTKTTDGSEQRCKPQAAGHPPQLPVLGGPRLYTLKVGIGFAST